MTTTDACSASNNANGGGYGCRTGQKKPLTDKNTRCVETVIGQLVEYFVTAQNLNGVRPPKTFRGMVFLNSSIVRMSFVVRWPKAIFLG